MNAADEGNPSDCGDMSCRYPQASSSDPKDASSSAPKGRKTIAQGIALGLMDRQNLALNGRNMSAAAFVPPFQGFNSRNTTHTPGDALGYRLAPLLGLKMILAGDGQDMSPQSDSPPPP